MAAQTPTEPLFFNRELSLLKFNERVLAMAEDPSTPILERLRYACIVSSNLDEFFEIRVSGLKEQERLSPDVRGPDGLTPSEVFDLVQKKVHTQCKNPKHLQKECKTCTFGGKVQKCDCLPPAPLVSL